ncbi:unnamed protein product, partial [Phaeothamnion confervicola]
RHVAEAKRAFDRFAVGGALTPQEALQALTESGSSAPRGDAARYFRSRGFAGMRRTINFVEFLHALSSL